MIKRLGTPIRGRVTRGAFLRFLSRAHELSAMNIFVTVVAQRRRLREVRRGIRLYV